MFTKSRPEDGGCVILHGTLNPSSFFDICANALDVAMASDFWQMENPLLKEENLFFSCQLLSSKLILEFF